MHGGMYNCKIMFELELDDIRWYKRRKKRKKNRATQRKKKSY